MAENWSGAERIDIACNQGKKIICSDLLNKQGNGEYRELISFSLNEDCPDLEVKLWVNDLSNLMIKSFELKKAETANCFAYFVTSTHFDRLEKSLIKQSTLGVDLKDDRILVTDANSDAIKKFPAITIYFGDRIISTDPWIMDENFGMQFNFSMLRNKALEFASQKNYDFLAFCDSDTILTIDSLSINPKINFAIPNVYWQKDESEEILTSLDIIENQDNPFSQGNSWFVISKNVINNVKFNEAIVGYGYEDIEFWAKCEHVFGNNDVIDFVIIHSYHPDTEKKIVPKLFDRNKFIFESCLNLVKSGFRSEGLTYVRPEYKDGRLFFHGPDVYLD